MTVLGIVLARVGMLEDGTLQTVPLSSIPFPYVRDKLVSDTTSYTGPRGPHAGGTILLLFPLGHRCSSVRVCTFAVNAARNLGGNHVLWC